MLDVRLQVYGLGKLDAFVRSVGPAGRRHLHTVGANALAERVRRHLRTVAPARHRTAIALGASPTRHIEDGISGVAPHADADHGEVVIPIAGIGRAYRDIRLVTPTSGGKNYYTIPKHRAAYGHTVAELRNAGWTVFRPGEKRVLLGYRRKGERPVVLYALAKRANLKRDPSLLPTAAEAAQTVVSSIAAECRRIIRKAR